MRRRRSSKSARRPKASSSLMGAVKVMGSTFHSKRSAARSASCAPRPVASMQARLSWRRRSRRKRVASISAKRQPRISMRRRSQTTSPIFSPTSKTQRSCLRATSRPRKRLDLGQRKGSGVDGLWMGGDDGECASPLGEWLGDAIEHALVLVTGEFVEFDVAAFAGECVWIGGEAMNAAAVSELEDVGAEVARIADGHLVEAFGAHLEPVCPAGAVFEIKPGLGFVARGNPDAVAGIVSAGFFDGVVGVDEGSADLTGLLHDFERGSIVVPFALEREKEFFFGAFHDK